jgi:hypothetical protein
LNPSIKSFFVLLSYAFISFYKLPVRFEEIEWTRGYGIAERPLALVIIMVWNILKDGIFDPGHMNMHMTRIKRAQAQGPLDRRNIHQKSLGLLLSLPRGIF